MKSSLPLENELYIMNNTEPSMAYKAEEDFLAWQKRAKAKLSDLLGMNKLIPAVTEAEIEYDRETELFREIRFRFRSEENYSVPCHLCIPHGAKKRLPLFICLQGHSPGMHVSLGRDESNGEGDRDFCIRAVKGGVCALAVEQRGFGECGGTDGKPDCYKASMSALLLGRTTVGERVFDVMRAIDTVTEYFSDIIDTDAIGCMGNSGGGTTTFYAACLEDRIKIAVPSCCFCTYDESIASIHHCSCNFIPHIREYFNMGDIGGLIAPKKLVIVSGQKDGIFPIEGARRSFQKVRELYSVAGVPDNCAMVIGEEGHRFYADKAWDIIRQYLLQK